MPDYAYADITKIKVELAQGTGSTLDAGIDTLELALIQASRMASEI